MRKAISSDDDFMKYTPSYPAASWVDGSKATIRH